MEPRQAGLAPEVKESEARPLEALVLEETRPEVSLEKEAKQGLFQVSGEKASEVQLLEELEVKPLEARVPEALLIPSARQARPSAKTRRSPSATKKGLRSTSFRPAYQIKESAEPLDCATSPTAPSSVGTTNLATMVISVPTMTSAVAARARVLRSRVMTNRVPVVYSASAMEVTRASRPIREARRPVPRETLASRTCVMAQVHVVNVSVGTTRLLD